MDTLTTLMASSVIACMAIIGCNKSRETTPTHTCINNLRQIEAAKEQWALETGKSAGNPVIALEVNAFIKRGALSCPAGGTYTYQDVGRDAVCSLSQQGHVLP